MRRESHVLTTTKVKVPPEALQTPAALHSASKTPVTGSGARQVFPQPSPTTRSLISSMVIGREQQQSIPVYIWWSSSIFSLPRPQLRSAPDHRRHVPKKTDAHILGWIRSREVTLQAKSSTPSLRHALSCSPGDDRKHEGTPLWTCASCIFLLDTVSARDEQAGAVLKGVPRPPGDCKQTRRACLEVNTFAPQNKG